jgi:hypothetical protein
MALENPELEFLHWLLTRFIKEEDVDPEKTTVGELIDRLNQALTPIGGG